MTSRNLRICRLWFRNMQQQVSFPTFICSFFHLLREASSFFVFNAAPAMTRVPRTKEVVIAPCGEMFARAAIESVSDNMALVRFVDIGDVKEVQITLLRELIPQIIEVLFHKRTVSFGSLFYIILWLNLSIHYMALFCFSWTCLKFPHLCIFLTWTFVWNLIAK